MQAAPRRQVSTIRLLSRRFSRAQGGTTAIEFGVLAPVFFALLGATLELSLAFFASQTLDSAVNDSARFIRTGQAQTQGWSAARYREEICKHLWFGFDCAELKISVRIIDKFENFASGTPIEPSTGNWTFTENYTPGNGYNIVLIEAYYKWPSIVSFPGLTAGLTADGKRLLAAARIFRNEPFIANTGS